MSTRCQDRVSPLKLLSVKLNVVKLEYLKTKIKKYKKN